MNKCSYFSCFFKYKNHRTSRFFTEMQFSLLSIIGVCVIHTALDLYYIIYILPEMYAQSTPIGQCIVMTDKSTLENKIALNPLSFIKSP